jgi:hypothetical protein
MRTVRPLLVWSLLCSCGGSATTSGRNHTATPPRLPPPRLFRVGGYEFGAERLPALSTDGRLVACAYEAEDGFRGAPNFKLVVKTVATDSVAREMVILTVTEALKDPDDAALADRIAAANAYLASTSWAPLPALTVTASASQAPARVAQGRDVRLVYEEPHLSLWARSALLVDKNLPQWSVTPYLPCPTCKTRCRNLAGLGGAWGSGASGVVLILVSYRETETCPAPDSQIHVMRF